MDFSQMSDAELEAIAGSQPAEPKGFDVRNMSDAELERIAGSAPQHQGALSNAPGGDTTGTAMAKGAATAAIKGVGNIPGTAGNLDQLTQYLIHRAHSWLTGTPIEEVQRQSAEKHAQVQAAKERMGLGWVKPPPPGEYFSDPILKQTGEYKPESFLGRAGMALVEGGTSGLGPGALIGGAGRGLAGTAKNVAGGALSGAAGDTAAQLSGDPLVGMAAGVAAPVAGAKVAAPAAKYAATIAAPHSKTARENLAADRLAKEATDPEKAYADLKFQPREIVEGADPTTGMAAGDIGLMKAQKRAANKDEDLAGDLVQREARENTARRNDLQGMAPDADPMAASKLFQERLAQLDDEMGRWVNQAQTQSDRMHGQMPTAVPPEVSATQLRDVMAENMKVARGRRKALYDAVDPDGTLAVLTIDARNAGMGLKGSIDPAVTIASPHAAPVIDMVANLGDVTPFKKLMDLDATISAKMAEAKRSGDYTGHAQLVEMKQAVMADINNAVENQAKFQQERLARGEIAPEETLGAKLSEALERQFSGAYSVGENSRAATGTLSSSGSAFPSAGRGTRGPAEGGRGDAGGDRGVQGSEPNFDAEAAQRLAAAKQAHAEFAQTYRQGPVGKALRDEGYEGQYRMPAAQLARQAFPSGDAGYTAASTFLNATNGSPQALNSVLHMAVYRLQQKMKDGPLTPQVLDAWKREYAPALRAIDEKAPGFSAGFDTVAKATDELANVNRARTDALAVAQKGAAAKLAGLTDAQEVNRFVGNMLTAKDGPTQIKQLMTEASGGAANANAPRAIDGLRKAGVDWMLNEFSNASVQGAEATLSSAKLRGFLADNAASVQALYGKDGLARMQRIAADMERSEAAFNAIRAKGGPDTAQQLSPLLHDMQHLVGRGAMTAGTLGYAAAVWHAFQAGGWLAGGATLTAVPMYHLMQRLHANGIASVEQLYHAGLRDPAIGEALLARAMDAKGALNKAAADRLVKAVGRSNAMLDTYRDDARVGRQTGGRIMDHGARANALIRAAERAKRDHNGITEQILGMPDEHVAKALAVANAAMR